MCFLFNIQKLNIYFVNTLQKTKASLFYISYNDMQFLLTECEPEVDRGFDDATYARY